MTSRSRAALAPLTGEIASQNEKGPAEAATSPSHGSPSAKKAEHMDNITAPADPATRPSDAAMRFWESIEHCNQRQLEVIERLLLKLRFKEDPSAEVIELVGEEQARPILARLGVSA